MVNRPERASGAGRSTARWTVSSAAAAGLLLAAATASPVHADPVPGDRGAVVPQREKVVRVAHGAVAADLIPVVAGQASPGDLRMFYAPLTAIGGTKHIGSLTGSLLTTAVDRPRKGWELRTADLVFTVKGKKNQLVVGGVARYKQKAATLAKRDVVIRPVVGGSGRYDGAHGHAKSIHLPDNTWKHIFTVAVDG